MRQKVELARGDFGRINANGVRRSFTVHLQRSAACADANSPYEIVSSASFFESPIARLGAGTSDALALPKLDQIQKLPTSSR
jgi:hypothetical protein